jgi:hypothetical protein
MYALDLDQSQLHCEINRNSDPPIYANACFVYYLLCHKVLCEKPITSRDEGDILLYFSGELAVHAARVHEHTKRAISKWGRGLFLEHEILDTPASYGSLVRCFEPIPCSAAEDHFKRYAECMGFTAG